MTGPTSAPDAAPAPVPAGLAALVRAGALDAELAALLWMLLEVRTPVVVAGPQGAGRGLVADALAEALPPGTPLRRVDAADEFTWMPEAVELGWRTAGLGAGSVRTASGGIRGSEGVLAIRDLADPENGGPGGERARLVVRALAVGYGMLATMPGTTLEAVLDRLADPLVGTDEDERSRLGVVLLMGGREAGEGVPARVEAAHYLRPLAYDTHRHVQRLPPAALATWNARARRWDHFAWGILAELGGRVGLRPVAFEREQAARAQRLAAAASC